MHQPPAHSHSPNSSSAEVCWSADVGSANNGWCGATHPGQADYTADLCESLSLALGGTCSWDNQIGYVSCGLTEEECKEVCVGMGDCAEMVRRQNGCCMAASSVCAGTSRTSADKFVVEQCPFWIEAVAGSGWCGADHSGEPCV